MIAAQMDQNNIVINRIVVDSLDDLPNLISGEFANIGDQYNPNAKTFEPVAVFVKIPQEVSVIQAKLAIIDAGLMPDVEAFISTLSAREWLYWNTSLSFKRDHPMIEKARIALGITKQQIDDLFLLAENSK